MKSVIIYVHGLPVGQPRVRACVRGRHAGVYDPGTANEWKACVIKAARDAMKEAAIAQFDGAVRLYARFMLPRPKGHFKTGKLFFETRKSAPAFHTKKPDLDNLEKSTMDALTNAGVWLDDSQVAFKDTAKRYTETAGAIGATIIVSEVVE